MLPFVVTASLTFVCAAASAVAAQQFLEQRIAIVGGFAGLQLSHNPGIAFGVHLPSPWQEVLIGAALCLVAWIAYRERAHRLNQIAFGMIVAGALANIVDRLPDGVVTDYLQVGTFPIFNVADSAITIGAGLLFIQVLLDEIHRRSGLTSARK